MWLFEIINLVFDRNLNQFALVARQSKHLFGILAMHFLHWNMVHLFSNTLPLVILGFLVSLNGKARQVTFSIMLMTGSLVWLFGRDGIHAGASALVLGYWGYLLSNAIFERSFKSLLLAALTILIYGGIVISLIDFRESTSFEGHLFGFFVGVLNAWIWKNKTP